MNSFFSRWIESYLFNPDPLQRLIGIAFFPTTVFYCIVTTYKRLSAKPKYYDIPVISIGNLLVGGTGKTPVTIAFAKDQKDVAVVLRGYGRASKGLYVISKKGKILEDVNVSGDEAMLLAKSLPNTTIIVSENRVEGIKKAKELKSKLVYLDDGYAQHNIQKLNILIRPKKDPKNIFCLPSGGYRDTPMMYSFADIVLREDTDFTRVVTFKLDGKIVDELPKDTIFLTAISKPQRVLEFLPKDIKMVSFIDHYNFTQKDIDDIRKKYPNNPIVTTAKDLVKLEKFNIKDLYLADLEITIDSKIIQKIEKELENSK